MVLISFSLYKFVATGDIPIGRPADQETSIHHYYFMGLWDVQAPKLKFCNVMLPASSTMKQECER